MKYSDFAIEQLKSRLAEKVMKDSTPKKCAGDMLEALEVIKQLQEQNRWISCSERLPKIDTEVIASDGEAVYCGMWYGYSDDQENEPCFYRWDDEWCNCYKPKVLAWMPLPEPYKEQN